MVSENEGAKIASSRSTSYLLGIVLTLLSSILWGSAYPIIQLALHYYDAFAISVYRAVGGAIVLAFYFLVSNRSLPMLARPRDVPILFLASILGASGFWTLLSLSVLYLEADTSSFLEALYPLIAVVLASVFFNEKMNKYSSVGVALGIFGTFVIVTLGENAHFSGASPLLGSLLAVISACSWSGYMAIMRHLVGSNTTTGTRARPEYITFNTFLFAIPLTVLMMLLTSPASSFISSSPEANLYVFYLGIVGSGIAFLIFSKGLKLIGMRGAAINQMLFPSVAVIASYVIIGETVNPIEIIGMCIIVAGILLAQVFAKRS